MNRIISQQYDHLKKKVEKLKKGLKMSRPNSAQRHQNEIIEDLRKELEKVSPPLSDTLPPSHSFTLLSVCLSPLPLSPSFYPLSLFLFLSLKHTPYLCA